MRINLPLFLALNYIETGQEMSHAINYLYLLSPCCFYLGVVSLVPCLALDDCLVIWHHLMRKED